MLLTKKGTYIQNLGLGRTCDGEGGVAGRTFWLSKGPLKIIFISLQCDSNSKAVLLAGCVVAGGWVVVVVGKRRDDEIILKRRDDEIILNNQHCSSALLFLSTTPKSLGFETPSSTVTENVSNMVLRNDITQ